MGWWCVAPKTLVPGDKGIYFEIDSLLPKEDSRFSFMEKKKYRVKTIKICGVLSQGLVLSLTDFPEFRKYKLGEFVTEKLKVKLYEPEVKNPQVKIRATPLQRALDQHPRLAKFPPVKFLLRFNWFKYILGKLIIPKKYRIEWPSWLPKTGSERIQNIPQLLEDKDTKWIISEKCVSGKSLVRTNQGMISIRKIVNQKLPVLVYSYNEDSRVVELKPILEYHRVPQTDKSHYKIGVAVKGKGNREKYIQCTEDHKILTPHGWLEAKDIIVGETVYHFIEEGYPQVLKEMLLGTLLGDSSLIHKGTYIAVVICQGEKQKEYFDDKVKLAGNFACPIVEYITGFGSTAYRFILKSNLWLYEYAIKNILREDKVVLTKRWMQDITPISLAFWYMDDGSLLNREDPSLGERIIFNTQAYSIEECELLKNMLQRFNIESTIHNKSCYKGNIISVGVEDAKKFFSLVAPYIVPSMKYKLPKTYENTPYVLGFYPFPEMSGMVETKVLSVEKLPPKSFGDVMFDITIERNHNYFADSVLVHNCDGCSTSFWLNEKDVYFVGSHNVVVYSSMDSKSSSIADDNKYIANNVWIDMGNKYDMKDILKQIKDRFKLKTVAIQGESYGAGIQKRTYSLKNKEQDLAVFHIWFDGKRLPIKQMEDLCAEYYLKTVTVYDYNYTLPDIVEDLIKDVDSRKSGIDGGDIEGFVIYSQDGQQNYKCVSPSYLLKYHS